MGFYANWFVPRLLDLAMRNRALDRYRHSIIGEVSGLVLEVGIGSGLNLPLYDGAVGHVYGVDSSLELLGFSRTHVLEAVVPVSLVRASAEHLPFSPAAFDTVVMTWTLCSIPNPGAALTEIHRVLKPGGSLLFVEHGLSPENGIAGWQHWLTPPWRRISGGCHLDRKMDDLIRAAGFRIEALQTGYLKGPKPWTFMYQGTALR